VLTPSRELSALYARGLVDSEVPRARQVVHQDFTFAPGVEVTEIEQVKGLEFDYVVLIEVSSAHFPDRPAARRLLHVGATRAVHQLWLTTVATPSPLVRTALADADPKADAPR
jgi:DNA helicase-2/ATP-dependent DNA helicase PcrA